MYWICSAIFLKFNFIVLKTCFDNTTIFSKKDVEDKSFLELTRTVFRFLKFSPQQFCTVWNWSPMFSLMEHPNTEVNYYATQHISIYLGTSDETNRKLKINSQSSFLHENLISSGETSLENFLLFLDWEKRTLMIVNR